MSFVNRLFGKKPSTTKQSADEIRKQIDDDYPEAWLQHFAFLSFATDEQLKNHLFETMGRSWHQRVLIVGGVHLFKELHDEDFPAFDICLNSANDLGWLCEFCSYTRQNQTPTMVASNFPREYAPPKVRFVLGPNYVAKLGSSVNGTAYTTVAPKGARVSLRKEDDNSPMSIFFHGVYAISYYAAVLQSQSLGPQQLLECQILTTPRDESLLISEQNALKSSSDQNEQRRILIKASKNWEAFTRFYKTDEYVESAAYSGGVLGNYNIPEKIPTRHSTGTNDEKNSSSNNLQAKQTRTAVVLVQDVYSITGIGIVPCGIVEDGCLEVGMKLNVNGTVMIVKSIESGKMAVQRAEKGDSIGFTVDGVSFEAEKLLLGSTNKSRIIFSEDGSYVNKLNLLSWGKGEKWELQRSPDGKNEWRHT